LAVDDGTAFLLELVAKVQESVSLGEQRARQTALRGRERAVSEDTDPALAMPEASDSQAHDRCLGGDGQAQQPRQEAGDSIVAVTDPEAADGDDT
jgi:hypothetical protein